MCDTKRKRRPNWLPSEKKLLIDLVEQHFDVVENKKTDGVSIKAKLAEWKIISLKYNSQTTHCHREAEALKSQWDNMKKAAKKEASHARMQGGGPPDPKKDDSIFSKIVSLIKASSVGLHNPYNNDSVVPLHANSGTVTATGSKSEYLPGSSNNIDINKIIEMDQQDITTCPTSVDSGDDCPTPELRTNIGQDVDITTCETGKQEFEDWGDYTPQLLQAPLCAQLKMSNNKSGISRRIPHHTPVTSSLESLYKEKIDAINLQKTAAAEEAKKKRTISRLEIEIKKEILKQEKIKTRLLLLELRKKKKENGHKQIPYH